MKLFHGSFCEVSEPDLSRCNPRKDFGRGFYLTTSLTQARGFSLLTLSKALSKAAIDPSQRWGVVSHFEANTDLMGSLLITKFPTADADWLKCVTAHRRGKAGDALVERYQSYDIIWGKIANDDTNATITAYMAGLFGEPDSPRAISTAISLLMPERLTDQLCFRTRAALDSLKFLGSEKIWMK